MTNRSKKAPCRFCKPKAWLAWMVASLSKGVSKPDVARANGVGYTQVCRWVLAIPELRRFHVGSGGARPGAGRPSRKKKNR